MHERRWAFKETNLMIKSDKERAIKAAIRASLKARRQLERFIIRHPEFRNSLEPVLLEEIDYPKIVNLMLRASEIAGIGPFAAVAGSISQVAAESGISAGGVDILVDNGGDIAMMGTRGFRVGIYAGSSSISGKFAFLVDADSLPIGICTSSGSVGHSVSFGDADAAVVVASEASVADAAATSVANEVKGTEIEPSIKRGLDSADDISEIRGCLIVREGYVGVTGKLPNILPLLGTEIKPGQPVVPSPISPRKFASI